MIMENMKAQQGTLKGTISFFPKKSSDKEH